jgi:hypothetical protein
MTATIRIGEPKARPTRPLTHLPARLDAEACLGIVERIDPELTAAGISASREQLDLDRIDSALEYTALSVSDKIRLKFALERCGLLARGKRIA